MVCPSSAPSPPLLPAYRLQLSSPSDDHAVHGCATSVSGAIAVLSEMEGGSGVAERMTKEREAKVEDKATRGEGGDMREGPVAHGRAVPAGMSSAP